MILHIVPDDKFIDMAYNIFEKASPNNNEFMVVTKQKEFKYIKTTPITKISALTIISKSFAKSLVKYEFVVLHWLDSTKILLISNSPKNVKFIWIGWGGDYYLYLNKPLMLEKTKKIKNNILKNTVTLSFKQKIKNYIKDKFLFKNIETIFNRINYFAPVLYEDFLLVKKQFKNFKPRYLDWNYGTLEDDLIKEDLTISGKNILLGNSATFENNHIEAIDLLSKLNLENRKVICPLSYGEKEYGNKIIEYGKSKLNSKFEALVDFMPIEQYNRTISSCSVVVMNHLRQQALGNIVIMMYFGAKIFLNKENPIYEFFKNNGAVVFSMEELSNENINKDLTKYEKDVNREALKKYWSRDVILDKTKKLIETMRSVKNA